MKKYIGLKPVFLWLLAAHAAVILVCWVALAILFAGTEDAFTAASILFLVLYAAGGYALAKKVQIPDFRVLMVALLVWALTNAVLIYIFGHADTHIFWLLRMPYAGIAITLFPSFFNGPQSAYVLYTLQPLLTALAYVLSMAVFGGGIILGKPSRESVNR